MNLTFNLSLTQQYKSSSQIARVLTEYWLKENVYCPVCGNNHLSQFANNSPVADFICNDCKSEYELKSQRDTITSKITDGAYSSMIERINSDNNPNFFFLNYSPKELSVKNLIVIPKHFFVNEIIERRKPLNINAKRAGWVGCNILLNEIPTDGKIFIIKDCKIQDKKDVLAVWAKTVFLSTQKKENRSWLVEIMKLIDQFRNTEFTLSEIYLFENYLKERFPNNNFIKDKIRQQLQVLRDKGVIEFKGNGQYKKL
jgi:type II restriction enzyme